MKFRIPFQLSIVLIVMLMAGVPNLAAAQDSEAEIEAQERAVEAEARESDSETVRREVRVEEAVEADG